MNRIEALESVKEAWIDTSIPLGDRVTAISEAYYGVGLDLVGTATYIGATPAELSVLLTMAGKSDEVLEALSQTNPPISACAVFVDATDEDILKALSRYSTDSMRKSGLTSGEFVYNSIIEIVGPTVEMKVSALSSKVIASAREKGLAYGKLNDYNDRFLKNIAGARRAGRTLTKKQVAHLERVLRTLCDEQVFTRNSLDNDQELCDTILDTLGL